MRVPHHCKLFIATFFFILSINIHLTTSQQCTDELECAFDSIISKDTDIECTGHQSCRSATSIRTLNESSSIYCNGSYSCYNAYEIQTFENNIFCGGLFSCAFVDTLTTITTSSNEATINCDGELSCYGSTIMLNNPNSTIISGSNRLQCRGERSCAGTLIYGFGRITIDGYLGGKDAVFISMPNNLNAIDSSSEYTNMTIEFIGTDSGSGTEIICSNNTACYIFCDGINSCENIKNITCDNCINVGVKCDDYSKESVWCQDGMYKSIWNCLFFVFDEFNLFSFISNVWDQLYVVSLIY